MSKPEKVLCVKCGCKTNIDCCEHDKEMENSENPLQYDKDCVGWIRGLGQLCEKCLMYWVVSNSKKGNLSYDDKIIFLSSQLDKKMKEWGNRK